MRPETFFYLLRVIARPCCAFWRSRCPPWSQGCSARPPIAAGVWYKHLDGGFPVLGARFGDLKSVKFGLAPVGRLSRGTQLARHTSTHITHPHTPLAAGPGPEALARLALADPSRPSREGAAAAKPTPQRTAGAGTAQPIHKGQRHFPLPSLVQGCCDGPLALAQAPGPKPPHATTRVY
jgi:hypothetical protein